MKDKAASDRKELVVFDIVRESECSKCGDELGRGNFIILEEGQALCMECADLDHLEYLHRGNAALTRRTRKYSRVSIVIVRWSRARKRYERQGIVAELEAIERAEQECIADADVRRRRQERAAIRSAYLDAKYVDAFAHETGKLYPGCPKDEARRIAEHACLKHSGRIGRSAAAQAFEPAAIDLAVHAAIRHRHTCYDELLLESWERWEAREEVEHEVRAVAEAWRQPQDTADDAGV